MNIMVTALGLGLIFGNGLVQLQQGASQTTQGASQQASPQSPRVQQIPVSPIGAPTQGVQITHGPVVENVTDTTAEIAWSTNVNSGTALHYGTDPSASGPNRRHAVGRVHSQGLDQEPEAEYHLLFQG